MAVEILHLNADTDARWLHSFAVVVLVSGALLAFGGCAPADSPLKPADNPAKKPIELEIPHPPDLSFAKVVREQLAEARAQLRRSLDRPGTSAAERAHAYGELGRTYDAYELRDAAKVCYSNAVTLNGSEHRWLFLLGTLHRMQGDLPSSRDILVRALAAKPDDPDTLTYLGTVEREMGNRTAAKKYLLQAMEKNSGTAAMEFARILIAVGEFERAVTILERLLSMYPDTSAIHYELGMAYRGLGQVDKAREELELHGPVKLPQPTLRSELVQLRRGARIHKVTGDNHCKAEKYAEAIEEYRRAIELAPEFATAYVNMGAAHDKLGNTDEALAAYRTSVRFVPTDAHFRFSLGALLARLGLESEALLHLLRAIELDPEFDEGNLNCGNALRRMGMFEDALTCYSTVVAHAPSDERARFAEIITLIKLERFEDALDKAEKSAAAVPESVRIQIALARLLATHPSEQLRDGPRALESAQKLQEGGMTQETVETLAMALAEVGDLTQAVEYQQMAIHALERAKREDLLPFSRALLEQYLSGQTCRQPYDPNGSTLAPPKNVAKE